MPFLPRLLRLSACIAAALILVPPAGSNGADGPYEIIAMVPLTGSAALQGRQQSQGLVALEALINRTGGIHGRPIKFEIVDTQSSPQITVQLMNYAAAKKVPAVLGPSSAAECAAVATVVKNGPVDYCTSPGFHPDPGSYVFSSGFSTVDLLRMSVRYLRERNLKRVAIIASTDAAGQDGERSLDAALALPVNKDMTLVAREHFSITDLNTAAQIARVKAAAPQALLVWTTGTPFGTILRSVHDSGLDIPVLTSPGNQTLEQMSAYAEFLPKEQLFTSGPFSAPDQITDRTTRNAVQQLYASLDTVKAPSFASQIVWDPALLVVAALRKMGTDATAAQVRDYIAAQRRWVGENGPYDFVSTPQRGLDGSSSLIVRWDASGSAFIAASKLGGKPLPK
jgi:branched-chain amino acid transport system substrate-binding protein